MISSTATLRTGLTLPLALAVAAGAAFALSAAEPPASSRTVSIADLGHTAAEIGKTTSTNNPKTSDSNSSRQSIDGDRSAASDTPGQSAASEQPAAETAKDPNMGHDGKPLTPELAALGERIRRTLAIYQPKHLNARDNTCWEIMHNLIAYGPSAEIFRDGPGGQTVNAMGWLCWGGRCQGQPLIVLENDAPHALYGVGLEGHGGQYLAMLAQWRVRPNSPMRIGGKDFTVADYIEEEKATCQSGTELTFKLLALSHYLPSDTTWNSRDGETWNIPKLLKAEIEAPVHGAACGGSHRLFAISTAVKERTKQGLPIDGQYARAAKYISDYQRYTLGNLQNPDGSFSTEWFNYAADRPGDIDRKLQTTGHMLEFLVYSLPEDQLRDPRVIKAVDFISSLMLSNPDKAWSVGPMGHALHAQMIYHQRMFNQAPLPSAPVSAGVPMQIKAKTIGLIINPGEPECEARPDVSMDLLQGSTTSPTANPQTAISQHAASDASDGCVESIPAKTNAPAGNTPPPSAEIRTAEKDPATAPALDADSTTVRE